MQLTSQIASSRSILHLHDNHFSGYLPLQLTNDDSSKGNLIVLGNKFRERTHNEEIIGINPNFKNIDWMYVTNQDIILSWITLVLLCIFCFVGLTYNCTFKQLLSVSRKYTKTIENFHNSAIVIDLRY